MSLSVNYENIHDAQMRLHQTVVLYDGEPVYITNIGNVGPDDPKGDVFRVYASPLPYKGDNQLRKFISSKKFDLAPFAMGFMNLGGLAYYCSRLPRRQQKQGLSDQTFSALPVGHAEMPGMQMSALVTKQEFTDCIKGKYPSYKEARKTIEEGGANSVAFSRRFALVIDPSLPELTYLYHKKDRVGFLLEDRVKLTKDGRCLKEALNEDGVPC